MVKKLQYIIPGGEKMESKQQLKIVVTFKPSEKWIYDEAMKHTGKSSWIKDLIIDYINAKYAK